MSSDTSLNREVSLRIFATTVGQEFGLSYVDYQNGYTEFSSVQPNGSPGFRIRGKVTQTMPSVLVNTNAIEAEIFNLGQDSRAIVQEGITTKMQIFAGYQGNSKQICQGEILWSKTEKQGPLYVTQILAGDSQFAQTNGEVHQSFKGSTTYKQVINACLQALESMQVFRGNIVYPPGGYNQGYTLNGSPLDELKKVCDKANYSFSLVGGMVNILPVGQDKGSPIIEVSTETGMVGIPEIHPVGAIGVVPAGNLTVTPQLDMSFTHLLRPELVISQRIRMKSRFVNGEYTILRNVFEFDSWSGPFYNRCQCQKVNVNVA